MVRNILAMVAVLAGVALVHGEAKADHDRIPVAAALAIVDHAVLVEEEVAIHFAHIGLGEHLKDDAHALHEEAEHLAETAVRGGSLEHLRRDAIDVERRATSLRRMLSFAVRFARPEDHAHIVEINRSMAEINRLTNEIFLALGLPVPGTGTCLHEHTTLVPGYGNGRVRHEVARPVVPRNVAIPGWSTSPVIPNFRSGVYGLNGNGGLDFTRGGVTFRIGR